MRTVTVTLVDGDVQVKADDFHSSYYAADADTAAQWLRNAPHIRVNCPDDQKLISAIRAKLKA